MLAALLVGFVNANTIPGSDESDSAQPISVVQYEPSQEGKEGEESIDEPSIVDVPIENVDDLNSLGA